MKFEQKGEVFFIFNLYLSFLGGWNIADCVQRAYDVEKMHVGTIAAGRIGLGVLRRLHPFDCVLHYTDRHRLPEEVEKELNLTYHEKVNRNLSFL